MPALDQSSQTYPFTKKNLKKLTITDQLKISFRMIDPWCASFLYVIMPMIGIIINKNTGKSDEISIDTLKWCEYFQG